MDWKHVLRWIAGGLLLGLFVSFALGPFIWQVITALKPAGQLAQLPPLLPSPPTAQHFITVLRSPGFLRVTGNSVFIAVTTMLLAFVLGVPAAYALAKLQVQGRNVILAALLCLTMFPAIANVAPLYLLFIHLGIRDSAFAVVITHSVFALPFTIWTLTNFFQEITPSTLATPL